MCRAAAGYFDEYWCQDGKFSKFLFLFGVVSSITFPKAAKLGNCAVTMDALSFSGTIEMSSTLGPMYATKDVY